MKTTIKVCPNDDGAMSPAESTFRFITGSAREANPRPETGLQLRCQPDDVEGEVARLRSEGRPVTITGPAMLALRRLGIDIDAGPWSEI
jgi:hypothetical protein